MDYDEQDLPPKSIEVNQKSWTRKRVDSGYYQWSRPMATDEYNWDADQITLAATDEPIRVVSLRNEGSGWQIEAAETAGPETHRPRFTELISSEYSRSAETLSEATQTVEAFLERLS